MCFIFRLFYVWYVLCGVEIGGGGGGGSIPMGLCTCKCWFLSLVLLTQGTVLIAPSFVDTRDCTDCP